MGEPKQYTGTWIPAYIMDCVDLSYSEKFLYAEIASYRVCFASNAHLAERMATSERQIQRWLANLVNHGFIIKTGFNGRTRQLVPVRDDKNDTPATTKSTPIDNSIENNIDIKTKAKDLVKAEDPEIIGLFHEWEEIFGFRLKETPTEKGAVRRILKAHDRKQISGYLIAANAGRADQYCPVITSFKKLEDKWYNLEAWGRRKQSEQAQQANRSVTITE